MLKLLTCAMDFRRLFLALLALVLCACLPAHAAANGLWATANGDYLLFLQDTSNGTTIGVQVPATLNGIKVYAGTGTDTALSLQSLANGSDKLTASYSASSMSGTLTTSSGQSQAFSASLALAWVANENAGVWQKSTGSNAYMIFVVLNTGGVKLPLQIDLTINADKSYSYDIFSGTLSSNNVFNGASLLASGLTSRLTFTSPTLNGSTSTTARPVQTTTYTAQQIIKISN